MKSLTKYWFVLLIILLIAGWFYWFEWRPTEARKECWESVKKTVNEAEKGSVENINNIYRWCLVQHGLKAEDLFNLEK